MKTLNTYITEWKANTNTVSSIKKKNLQYFIFEQSEKDIMKIFDGSNWPQFKKYKNKVYINGEQIELGKYGFTLNEYNPGTYIIEIKDIDKVENTSAMFWGCSRLVSVPLFDTSNVENMNIMFSYCEKLKDIPLFDTSNVTNMDYMLCGCKNLKNVPLFNTSKVYTMCSMFSDCYELEDVPLFDTHNVENMNNMFLRCNNLNEQTKKEWSQIYNFETHNKQKK